MEGSNKKDYFYPARVWLLDVCIVAPISLLVSLAIRGENVFGSDTPQVLKYVIIVGLLYSLPTLALMYIVYLICVRQERERNATKLICCVFCLAAILLTFLFLFREDAYQFIFPYAVATIVSFLIMPLKYHPGKQLNIESAMDNSVRLIPGQLYKVTKQFIDFDRISHDPGETWVYQGTHFLPYDDGLTLHVLLNGKEVVFRLQWREEEQGPIIDHFSEYVEAVK